MSTHTPIDHRISLTDSGNAERLVHHFGSRIRWVGPRSQWLVWDDKRWVEDETELLMRLAKRTAHLIRREAEHFRGSDTFSRWKRQSKNRPRLDAMIRLAQSNPGIAVTQKELDADPWLLNVQNGVVDLRTGELRKHSPARLLTKICDANYQPGLTSQPWQDFLAEITGGSEELQSYLKRVAGCALSGAENEKRLFVLWGPGDTGKTTFITTLMHVLDDYAFQAERNLLLQRSHDAHTTGIADLFGRRLAVCSEVNEGQNFDSGLVKQLTGGDRLTARRMRQNNFEFDPTHTIVLACNDVPHISPEDGAMWGRLSIVPFTNQIPEDQQDKHLAEALREDADAILTWAVEGCLEWQAHGLAEPKELIDARNHHRGLADPVFRFINEECELTSEASEVEATSLYQSFAKWVKEMGLQATPTQKTFGKRLTALGIARDRATSGRVTYRGIRPPKDPKDPPLSTELRTVTAKAEDPSEGSVAAKGVRSDAA